MKWCEKQTTNYGTLGRGINVTQVFEKRVEVLSKFKHNYRRRAKIEITIAEYILRSI